jgi:hypothetical protein
MASSLFGFHSKAVSSRFWSVGDGAVVVVPCLASNIRDYRKYAPGKAESQAKISLHGRTIKI